MDRQARIVHQQRKRHLSNASKRHIKKASEKAEPYKRAAQDNDSSVIFV